jgi:5'-methylthioadenosine phosphorylase
MITWEAFRMSDKAKSGVEVDLAVIGGSGLYAMEGLEDVETVKTSTPFGDPSDDIVLGTLAGRRIAFLARHGRGHTLMPADVNYRANICALKGLGVTRILSITCCGSLKEELAPGHVVVPDQTFDNTRSRRGTFFGEGLVAHISVADPFCPAMSAVVAQGVAEAGGTVHMGGTYVIIEGPRFSTKAESAAYRHLGFDIIGMTAVPEAQLAREAEICYASLAHITDYDVWNEKAATATVESVLRQLQANTHLVTEAVRRIVPLAAGLPGGCSCQNALADALITDREMVPSEVRQRLGFLIDRYF